MVCMAKDSFAFNQLRADDGAQAILGRGLNSMKKLNSLLCSAAALAFSVGAAVPVTAQDAASAQATGSSGKDEIVVVGHPAIGDFGLDLAAEDHSVKPGDDFDHFASGTWLKTAQIPADRPLTGSVLDVTDHVQNDLKQLITQAPPGTRYGTMYASFMNENAVERAGLKPLMADLAAVKAISDKRDFARYMGATITAPSAPAWSISSPTPTPPTRP